MMAPQATCASWRLKKTWRMQRRDAVSTLGVKANPQKVLHRGPHRVGQDHGRLGCRRVLGTSKSKACYILTKSNAE